MGITPAVLRMLARHCRQHWVSGAVLTLGNQDVWCDLADAARWLQAEGLTPSLPEVARPHSSAMFKQLAKTEPQFESYIHAATLFQMMGFTDYADLDNSERDQPIMRCDLNEPAPRHLRGRFDLVLDLGTMEHVFNVPNVLETVARMLKPGGWVVHVLPLPLKTWSKHGYYCFNPDLLLDYYALNSFRQLECKIFLYERPRLGRPDHRVLMKRARYFDYRPGMSLEFLVPSDASAMIWFAARKREHLDQYRFPIQGESSPANGGGPVDKERAINKYLLIPLFLALYPLSAWLYTRWNLAWMARI